MRLLALGTFHFVSPSGIELDEPEIDSIDKVVKLETGEDACEVGERYLHEYDSYCVFSRGDEHFDLVKGIFESEQQALNA